MPEVLTSNSRPKSAATLTVRIIKSFQYRTERSLVLHELDLETTTVADLKNIARNAVLTQSGWKPYRSVALGPPLSLLLLDSVFLISLRHPQALHKGPWCQGTPGPALPSDGCNLIPS
ncbi:hypothetical protein C0992_008902 [Termitomyces sp. T32_za158]|nr:hypothetical protein C0992_008902 [Termitomyces sp. T32_za158]